MRDINERAQTLWESFTKSGNIADYLVYRRFGDASQEAKNSDRNQTP